MDSTWTYIYQAIAGTGSAHSPYDTTFTPQAPASDYAIRKRKYHNDVIGRQIFIETIPDSGASFESKYYKDKDFNDTLSICSEDDTTEYFYQTYILNNDTIPSPNPVKIIYPNGDSSLFYYHAPDTNAPSFFLIDSTFDELSRKTEYYYDTNYNLDSLRYFHRYVSGVGTTNVTTDYTYNSKGNLTQLKDPRGNSTHFQYAPNDTGAYLTETWIDFSHTGGGQPGNADIVTKYKYNADIGKVDTIIYYRDYPSDSSIVRYVYDVMNRLKETYYPDGTYDIFTYDKRGNLLKKEIGKTGTETKYFKIAYEYDAMDHLIKVKEYKTALSDNYDSTFYKYNLDGDLIGFINANDTTGTSTEVKYSYDADRLLKVEYPDTTTDSLGYFKDGNLMFKRDRKGKVVAYVYDDRNRLTRKRYFNSFAAYESPDSTPAETLAFSYDKVGNMVVCVKSTGVFRVAIILVGLKNLIEKGIIKRYTPLWLFTPSKQCYKNIKPERSITMITIRIKSIDVNKKISIDEESVNFGIFEEELYELGLEVGVRIMEHILMILDDQIRKGRGRKTLENRGKEGKYLSTKMGNIDYNRTRYYDRGSGGYRYLLDEALGLEKRQAVSIGRRKLEAMMAVKEGSYRGAQVRMGKLTGLSRSHEAIRGVVLQEGKRLRSTEKKLLQRVYNLEDEYTGDTHDVVYVEVDGTGIKSQCRGGKRGKGIEVKVGICYTGKQRRYRGGSGGAKVLKNKYVHLDIESGSKFVEEMSLAAEREAGLSKAKRVVIGGDGAKWIRKGIGTNFPGAIYKLCEYHLNKRITESLSGIRGAGSQIRRLLQDKNIDGALSTLWNTGKSSSNNKQLKSVMELYGYIQDNREGIVDLSDFDDTELGIEIEHTGAIENTVDKAVAHRFKKHGFKWSKEGARSLLKVEQAMLNGRWDSWWSEDRDKVIKVDMKDVSPLSAAQMKGVKDKGCMDEISLPCFRGPDQSKPWVKGLKDMIQIKKL